MFCSVIFVTFDGIVLESAEWDRVVRRLSKRLGSDDDDDDEDGFDDVTGTVDDGDDDDDQLLHEVDDSSSRLVDFWLFR